MADLYKSHPCETPLKGAVRVPSDKSISHRALLMGAIAEGTSIVHNLLMGEDNKATLSALSSMGVPIEAVNATTHKIDGVGLFGLQAPSGKQLNLGNSGTGIRLLAGILAAQPFESILVGDDSLMKRPMRRIIEPLRAMGGLIGMSLEGTPPLHILPAQRFHGIRYEMPVASAQVKSCLLLAGLFAVGDTIIVEPTPSRDHTERMLIAMDYPIEREGSTITLQDGGRLRAGSIQVPADISSAAFFIIAALIQPDSEVLLEEVGINPTRTGILTILEAMGADIELRNRREFSNEPVADIFVKSSMLQGVKIDPTLVPLAIDELPILMIAAACAKGTTVLRGAEELRVKESDRIEAMANGLKELGIQVEVFEDGMAVTGGEFTGGSIDSFTDHRIAMSFLIAGAVAKQPIEVRRCENIETSFPGFSEQAKQINLNIEEM